MKLMVLVLVSLQFAGISGLTIDDGPNIPVKYGSSTSVQFSDVNITIGSNTSSHITIKTKDSDVIINGTILETTNTGEVLILPEFLEHVPFGSYPAVLTIQNFQAVIEREDLVILYEEAITNLKASEDPVVAIVNQTATLGLYLSTGSNVNIKWIVDDNNSFNQNSAGIIRNITFNVTFNIVQSYNVSAVVNNTISRPEMTTILVHVIRPIMGFNISLLNTTNVAVGDGPLIFSVSLDSMDRLPMGNIVLDLKFDNVSVLAVDLNNHIENMVNGSYLMSYQHTGQGHFTVVASVFSPVDIQQFLFHVGIWDNITFPSTKLLTKPGHNIFIMDYTLERQIFEYDISFGNGDVIQSDPNILQYGLQTPWSYNYSDSGTYKITVKAWNPLFSYSNVRQIRIVEEIPPIAVYPQPTDNVYFPLSGTGVSFAIKMLLNMSPPEDMFCLFTFESGDATTNHSVSLTYTNPFNTSHIYTTGGEKEVSILCNNPVDQTLLSTKITILPLITGFALDSHNEIYFDDQFENMTKTINFRYSIGELLTASADILAIPAIQLITYVDPTTKTGYVIISWENLVNLSFGTYKVEIRLSSLSGEVQKKDVALFFQERIDGFQVFQHDDLNLIKTDTDFEAIFQSGSNLQVELIFTDIESMMLEENTVIRQLNFTYVFNTPLLYSITSVARNALGNTVTDNLNVEVVRNVSGFSVEMMSNPVNSFSDMTFILRLDTLSRLPMGTVFCYIDFDDGSEMNMAVNDKYSTLVSSQGYLITHYYTKQGEKNVSIIFKAELTQQIILLSPLVWDNITPVRVQSTWVAKVNEFISYTFVNVLKSGFQYNVAFGDGNNISNDPDVLFNVYNEGVKYHHYDQPGIYKVTFSVHNPFYNMLYEYNITIQYPIPELRLTPQPPYMIPLPNGDITFTIFMGTDNPTPTSVSCVFKYEDSPFVVNETIEFVYNTNISRDFTYFTGGVKHVNVTCVNYVSSKTLLTTIDVQPVILDDYSFDYLHIVPVNMSSDADHLPALVKFNINLYKCVRFSPSVTFYWDFDDGSEESLTTDEHQEHTYHKRGHYNITVVIKDLNSKVVKTLPIKIGAVDLKLERYIGDVNNAIFKYSLSGIGIGGTYELILSIKETMYHTQTNESEVFVHEHTYPYYIKQYRPNVIAKNANYTEVLYFDDFVKVDYNLTVVKFSVTERTYFPPGDVTVKVYLEDSRSSALPFVTCVYDMGDYIDYSIYKKTQNITYDEPLVFDYQYKVLGNLTAKITCSNNFDRVSIEIIVESFNDCFTVSGIFDRQYSNTSNPMKVYTSSDFDLASRMSIYCVNLQIEFNWELYVIDENNDEHVFEYTPVVPPRGTFRFLKGSMPENLYKVGLNVTLLGKTWIWEPTYVKFIKPLPYAYIEGGFVRTAKIWKTNVTIDAFTSSYDVSYGFGANQNLQYEWNCELITAIDLEDLSNHYKQGTNRNGDCTELMTKLSTGIAVLNLLPSDKQGYAITVSVSLTNSSNPMSTQYVQLIMGDNSNAPTIEIQCKLNCDKKYAIMSKSIWTTLCTHCGNDTSTLEYVWELRRFDDILQYFVKETNLLSMTETGIDNAALSILENQLIGGIEYEIRVTVNHEGESDVQEVKLTIKTNLPPYDGSCRVSNHSATGRAAELVKTNTNEIQIGTASKTLFAIHCNNWKDEGFESDQISSRDGERKNPLIYEYILVQNYTDDNGNVLNQSTLLYKGGESTASEIRMPAGELENNYTMEIYVNIYDSFGDYSSEKLFLKVYPYEEYTIQSETDVEKTASMLRYYDDNYDMTDAGGNDMAVFRLMSASAGFYKNIKFENSTLRSSTTSLDEVLSFDDEIQSDVQDMLQQRTSDFVNKISGKVPENSSLVMLPADSRLIAKTLDTCISNVDVMSENSSATVSNAAYNIIQNIQKVSSQKPYPMTEVSNIQEATSDVINVLSKNVDFLSKASEENINKSLTKEMVAEELQEYYRYHPEGIPGYPEITNDLIAKTFAKKQKIRQRQSKMASSTKQTADKLLNAIEVASNITASTMAIGEGEKVIKKKSLNISVEKNSIDMFINKTDIQRDGFSLDMKNVSLENISSTEIELQVSVFQKSPLLHANGNSKLKGRIMGITARNENHELIEIPLEMKIQNEGVALTSEYTVSLDGTMEFITYLQDQNDAVLVYINPEGFDEYNINTFNYSVYVKSKTSPSTTDYDFKTEISAQSWTVFGFKVFVPSGLLEEGNIIISLSVKDGPKGITTGNSRQKRSTEEFSNNQNETLLTNMSIAIVTTGCRVFDPKTQSWNPNGCSVLSFSTINETVCRCPPGIGTLFASSFFTPNLIDFHNVFDKFDVTNAAVYGTIIVLIVLYIFGVICLRRKDKTDVTKWTPHFLCDNKAGDNYFYMISVHTGLRPASGTQCNVCFILTGEKKDSGVRLLSNGTTKGFATGSVCTFIMSTDKSFGDLSYIRIWHDNSAEENECSWYLHKIVVRDLQTQECFLFLCDEWFAIDMGDGMIDRILAAMSKFSRDFETLISQHARLNVTENHLWLSLIMRPQKSIFTRVQRFSCILALLFLSMITNAMFFQPEDDETVTADTVRIGPVSLSLKSLYVSIIGAVITVIPILTITYLFKNCRPKEVTLQTSSKDGTELNNSDAQNQHQIDLKFKETGRFPNWVKYIAWIIVFLSVVTSAFFLLLYSMQWGKDMSNEWLVSFVLSFFESILVVDPVKVLIFAILITLITRRPVENDEVSVDLNSVKQSSELHAANYSQNGTDLEELKFIMHSMKGPLPADVLKAKRERIRKEKIAKSAFLNLILHLVFSALVFSISYITRDERSYLLKANVENYLYTSNKQQFGFSKVTSQKDFIYWMTNTLLPVYFPTSSYNGGSISVLDKFFIADMTNVRLGLIRLRQLRVKKESCYGPSILHGHFCGRKYGSDNENEDDYCQGCSDIWLKNAWQYTSAHDIDGVSLVGKYNSYDGGGYISFFDNEKTRTEKTIDELVNDRWIDRLTRAVFVEFTTFNANVNLMAYSIFMVEFPETGGAINWFDTQCFRPSVISDATGLFSVICFIFFILIIFLFTVNMIKRAIKEKRRIFHSLWIFIDICLLFSGYSAFAVWISKIIITKGILQTYYNDKNIFVNFEHIIIIEYIYTCVLGFLCFVSTLRLMKALGYNKRLTEIGMVLRVGGIEIVKFLLVFMYCFAAFVILGYFLFGQNVFEWRNMFVSFGSLTNTLIGRNSLNSMIEAAPNFAEIYFFVYVFFVLFTMMTMFQAILNKAIQEVRRSPEYKEESIVIFDVLKGTLNDIVQTFGIHVKNKKTTSPSDKYVKDGETNQLTTSKVLRLVRDSMVKDFSALGDDERKCAH